MPEQDKQLDWERRMDEIYQEVLTDEEKDALHEWEKANPEKSEGITASWPGWKKHIGKSPGATET